MTVESVAVCVNFHAKSDVIKLLLYHTQLITHFSVVFTIRLRKRNYVTLLPPPLPICTHTNTR